MKPNLQLSIPFLPCRRLHACSGSVFKAVAAILALLSAPSSPWAVAQGIPEPSLVMYGVVRSALDPDQLRIVFGRLTWQFEPVGGGASLAVSTALTNIHDQFSYVLYVPCETEVAGIPLSTNVLRLGSSYTRGTVLYDGELPATLVDPTQASFSLSTMGRGRVERVDLEISIVLEDLDGNGLPDAWERLFFGQTGVDPFADADSDGVNNGDEYKAGTDPRDPQSLFRFIRITTQPDGVLVEWPSVGNRSYSVLRSTDVLSGYEVLSGSRPATPPVNSFLDTLPLPPGRNFYLLRLEE